MGQDPYFQLKTLSLTRPDLDLELSNRVQNYVGLPTDHAEIIVLSADPDALLTVDHAGGGGLGDALEHALPLVHAGVNKTEARV